MIKRTLWLLASTIFFLQNIVAMESNQYPGLNNNNTISTLKFVTKDHKDKEIEVDKHLLDDSITIKNLQEDLIDLNQHNQVQEQLYITIPAKSQKFELLLNCLRNTSGGKDKELLQEYIAQFQPQEIKRILKLATYLDISPLHKSCVETLAKYLTSNAELENFARDAKCTDKLIPNKDIEKELLKQVTDNHPNAVVHMLKKVIRDYNVPSIVLPGYSILISWVKFNKLGNKVLSASGDNVIRIWDVGTGVCIHELNCTARIWMAAFNKAGNKVVSATSDGMVRIWDTNSGRCIGKLRHGYDNIVLTAEWNKTEDKIASASHSASHDAIIRIWDVQTEECIHELKGHTGIVWMAGFDKRGDKIVSASEDETVRIWDVKTGKCLQVLSGHTAGIPTAKFNKSGDKIISLSHDETIRIWNVQTGACIQELKGHTRDIKSAEFNKTGDKIVSAAEDNTIRVWEVQTGKCIHELRGHIDYVRMAVFNEAGDKIVSASDDRTIRIWNVQIGACMQELKGHTNDIESAEFNKAGDKIVSASVDKAIRIWDIKKLVDIENYLKNELSLKQALLLIASYKAQEKESSLAIYDKSGVEEILFSYKNFEEEENNNNAQNKLVNIKDIISEHIRYKEKKKPNTNVVAQMQKASSISLSAQIGQAFNYLRK